MIRRLLDQRLIACGSIFPAIESVYRWEGKIEQNTETKVVLKTISRHFEAVRNYIESNCSYEVPEISQVDIIRGNPRYTSWVIEETS
jgi:periplasmic divalent cation tolerance protein